jgi:3-deoxy-D-arabino-heptulosonate 7-phosphate (DAHP) synthase
MSLKNQEHKLMVVAGPCAVESKEQTLATARSIHAMKEIVAPFGITMGMRGGAWKPRTLYHDKDSNKIFEGTREDGLSWLAEAGHHYDLPVFSECMSEQDLRHFGRLLNFDTDFIQVGARTSKAYALLHAIGGQPFGVLLKSPENGVKPREAVGSLSRMTKNREMDLIYCIRGQHPFIDPDDMTPPIGDLYERSTQHPDSRNLNNINQINRLRADEHAREFFSEHNVRMFFDPSHTFGGANDEVRQMIGRYAIEAVTNPDYAYDGLLIEVNDRPDLARCDGAQATLTTKNKIDWARTNAGQKGCVEAGEGRKPQDGREPYSLVDILCAYLDFQAERPEVTCDRAAVKEAKQALHEIEWQDWADE